MIARDSALRKKHPLCHKFCKAMKIKRLYKMKKIIKKSVFHPESLQPTIHKRSRMTKKVFTLLFGSIIVF